MLLDFLLYFRGDMVNQSQKPCHSSLTPNSILSLKASPEALHYNPLENNMSGFESGPTPSELPPETSGVLENGWTSAQNRTETCIFLETNSIEAAGQNLTLRG